MKKIKPEYHAAEAFHCIIAKPVHTDTRSAAMVMQMKVHCPIKLLDERIKWNRTRGQHWLQFRPIPLG